MAAIRPSNAESTSRRTASTPEASAAHSGQSEGELRRVGEQSPLCCVCASSEGIDLLRAETSARCAPRSVRRPLRPILARCPFAHWARNVPAPRCQRVSATSTGSPARSPAHRSARSRWVRPIGSGARRVRRPTSTSAGRIQGPCVVPADGASQRPFYSLSRARRGGSRTPAPRGPRGGDNRAILSSSVPFAPPRSLSPSKVALVHELPLAFRLSIIDRLPEAPSSGGEGDRGPCRPRAALLPFRPRGADPGVRARLPRRGNDGDRR